MRRIGDRFVERELCFARAVVAEIRDSAGDALPVCGKGIDRELDRGQRLLPAGEKDDCDGVALRRIGFHGADAAFDLLDRHAGSLRGLRHAGGERRRVFRAEERDDPRLVEHRSGRRRGGLPRRKRLRGIGGKPL